MVVVFSERSNDSEYVAQEVIVAAEARKVIIVFRIEDAMLKGVLRMRLSGRQWIDAFVSRDGAIGELVGSINRFQKKASDPMPLSRRDSMRPPPPVPSSAIAPPDRKGGWLVDALSRASHDGKTPAIPSVPQQGSTTGIARKPGWLVDILSRPSRGERPSARADGRLARHSTESFDALSVDIARMIDHDAAIELWDRYGRGEGSVFTERLYTMQGQRTFEEIRKRYRADREFKQTVDRYIAEFERLLDDVSRDDRGAAVARSYLTSETGKVYTMLAHAAGRFE